MSTPQKLQHAEFYKLQLQTLWVSWILKLCCFKKIIPVKRQFLFLFRWIEPDKVYSSFQLTLCRENFKFNFNLNKNPISCVVKLWQMFIMFITEEEWFNWYKYKVSILFFKVVVCILKRETVKVYITIVRFHNSTGLEMIDMESDPLFHLLLIAVITTSFFPFFWFLTKNTGSSLTTQTLCQSLNLSTVHTGITGTCSDLAPILVDSLQFLNKMKGWICAVCT